MVWKSYHLLVVAVILGALVASPISAQWKEGSLIGVHEHHPKQVLGMFVNTYTGTGLEEFPPNQWVTIDLTGRVPPGTVGVFLSTLLVITNGTSNQIANLTIAHRAFGSPIDNSGNYDGQAVAWYGGDGVRSPLFTLVALTDGKFQIYWTHTPGPPWPDGAAYAINMGVSGYIR